ncbi:hypothetical protein F7725_000058 [Dissostichus mawsoni]|uniref:Uncharacterized protein n=1 Tax=Dissostichus mawsoni TaxID=36200 RepID=A0A7J5ZDY9_DISMA|nr:hypothetical protein F7725_000058 [Dissostichus mawsoni]
MIHHEFGSKALVNELNALGHCVSYNEVRQFLTTVSADEITRNKEIYIPTGLSGILDHGMIDAAIDNFDQNEETLDGKHTTHSMATVIYRRGQTTTEPQRLARIPQKTLSALNNYDVDGEELHRYSKPTVRPELQAIHEPSQLLNANSDISTAAGKRDTLWKLARIIKDREQHVPSWSAFNAFITNKSSPVVAVQYMPFIRAAPTYYSTIYTALIRLTQLSAKLGQKHILVTADLAIYCKAQEIMWSKPSSLHGKLYGDGRLLSILIESDVYGDNTARQMLQGKQLSRGVQSLKIIQ